MNEAAPRMNVLTDALKHEIDHEASLYEQRAAAGIDALKIVQRHTRWISDETLREVAEYLGMTAEELESVATFYNGLYRRPVGRHVIRQCTSVSCWIFGCDRLQKHLQQELGIKPGQTTADGRFTLVPVQCLGACDRAQVLMIDDDLHGNIDEKNLAQVLETYQ